MLFVRYTLRPAAPALVAIIWALIAGGRDWPGKGQISKARPVCLGKKKGKCQGRIPPSREIRDHYTSTRLNYREVKNGLYVVG